jgi:phospholipid/cholesterol/gamma-HCH transport system substrate-binding protein
MARKTSKFMIGLFVTIGVLLGLIAVVWLGASKYLEKGGTYAAYFDESVQGLQKDSTVKYRGVDVGRVEKIRVAPDNELIEVVMKINLKGELQRTHIAQLRPAGITGIVFIELDRKEPGEEGLSPKLSFPSEYPIIASKPSEIKQILSGVQGVLENLKKIDAERISEGIVLTVANLNGVITKVDSALAGKRLDEVIIEAKNTLLKIQNFAANIEGEIQTLNLAKTGAHVEKATARLDQIMNSGEVETILGEVNNVAKKMGQVVDGLDKRSLAIMNNIRDTSENLKRASESLEMLIDRVYASPSDLLFSQPPPPRGGNQKQER